MPFIKFDYCYRDAANYKNYGSKFYSNAASLDIKSIRNLILQGLIDGEWFAPGKWKVPALYFKDYSFDPALDHGWHEFVGVYECSTADSDLEDIQVLLDAIKG